jgi:hypothetical protein
MSKYVVKKDELITHLKEQIQFLVSSAISYDNGSEGEAKRSATTIRVLVYDSTHSSALLTQLNKMNVLFFDSASVFEPSQPLTSSNLLMHRLAKEEGKDFNADYIAPLDDLPPTKSKEKKVSFETWWRRNMVFKDNVGNTSNRRDIILAVADKEGGAHVDPKLDEAYANLTRFNSLAWRVHTGSEEKNMGNPVLPGIRQIAHEVIKTLKEGILDLFTDRASLLNQFETYENHCLQLSIQRGFVKEVAHLPTSS